MQNPNMYYSGTEVNFGNNPTTYFDGGRLFILRFGRYVILRFVDIHVRNSPSTGEVFYSNIPQPLYDVSGVLVSTSSTYGSQKIMVSGSGITNYFSTDGNRNNQSFSGEIMYFTAS